MDSENQQPSMRKRLHYTPATDIQFLTEILAKNPWGSRDGWVELAVYMRTKPGFVGVEAKSLRDRANLLLSRFRAEDMLTLRKSGTEEEYTEREQLLQEVADLEQEWRRQPEKRGAANVAEVARAKAARATSRINPLLPPAAMARDTRLPDVEEDTSEDTRETSTTTAIPQATEAQTTDERQEPVMTPNLTGWRSAMIGSYLKQKATLSDIEVKLRDKEIALRQQDLDLRREHQAHRHAMERRKLELEAAERAQERAEIQKSRDDFRDLMTQQTLLMKTIMETIKKTKNY